jgi:hypothetical protein
MSAGIDFSHADVLQLAQFSSASYLHDARPTVAALGGTYLTQIGNGGCEVLVLDWGGNRVFAYQGTRASLSNFSAAEVLADLECHAKVLADGSRVHSGFWDPLVALWPRLAPFVVQTPMLLTGHSLGGVHGHLTKPFVPHAQVVSFGAPKGADDKFWTANYQSPPVRFVYEKDVVPALPFEGPFTHPASMNWLHGGKLLQVHQRPGLTFSVSDHSMDHSYTPAIRGLKEAA